MKIKRQLLLTYFSVALQALYFAYVARQLGPNLFGRYSFVNSIFFFVFVFLGFGVREYFLSLSLLRFKYYLSLAYLYIAYLFLAGFALVPILHGILMLLDSTLVNILSVYLLFFSGLFSLSNKVIEPFLYFTEQGMQISMSNLSATIYGCISFYVLTKSCQVNPLLAFSLSLLLAEVLGLLIRLRSCKLSVLFLFSQYKYAALSKGNFGLDLRKAIKRLRSMLHASQHFLFANLNTSLYMYVDKILIGFILGPSALGIYSISVRLCDFLYIPSTIFVSNSTHGVVKILATSRESLSSQKKLIYFLHQNLMLSIACVCFGYVIMPHLLLFAFGVQYYPSIEAFYCLLPCVVIVAIGNSTHLFLVANSLQSMVSKRAAAGSIANIILTPILVATSGLVGASVSSLISYSVSILYPLLFSPSRACRGKYAFVCLPFLRSSS